ASAGGSFSGSEMVADSVVTIDGGSYCRRTASTKRMPSTAMLPAAITQRGPSAAAFISLVRHAGCLETRLAAGNTVSISIQPFREISDARTSIVPSSTATVAAPTRRRSTTGVLTGPRGVASRFGTVVAPGRAARAKLRWLDAIRYGWSAG